MDKRFVNICFIVVFMLILLIPPLFSDKSGGDVSEEENRVLAERPHLDDLLNTPGDFPEMAENWLADNIRFRRTMIRIYRELNKIETHDQYWIGQNMYLIGEDGHHFFAYYSGSMIDKFSGEPILYEEELAGMANSMSNIKAYLDEKGIPLIIMFATDKETVYPEYYPKSIARNQGPVPLDSFTDYIRENTGADTFNIRAALTKEKNNYLLYNKSKGDLAHYNVIGGFFAYQELMRHIQAYLPDIRIMSVDEVSFTYEEEDIPSITLNEGLKYEALGDDFYDGLPMERPFLRGTAATRNIDPGLPTLLMMRDSYYSLDLLPELPQSFSQTLLIDYLGNMGNFRQYIETYNPDIVVFGIAEREIAIFANDLSRSGAW